LTSDGTSVLIQAETYTAKFRTADRRVAEVATRCRDKEAAKAFLGELVRREELVKGKVISRAEADAAGAAGTPVGDHVEEFLQERLCSVTPAHHANLAHNLRRVVKECGFRVLADVTRQAVEGWGAAHRDSLTPATLNRHRSAILAFVGWCVKTRRLGTNPLLGLARDTEPIGARHAFTVEELGKLLDAARRRPLCEALQIRRGRRKGELAAEVGPAVRKRL
jgi:hypothetical protein